MTAPSPNDLDELPVSAPLRAGDAVATNRNRVNLRAWMSTSAPVRAKLQCAERATVLSDSFRHERRAWAHVRMLESGLTGCIAAEMLDLVESGPAAAPSSAIPSGDRAYRIGDYLTTDTLLPLYDSPGNDRAIVQEIERNSLGIALDGPVSDGAATWLPVRFPEGSGWIETDTTQLLARDSRWIEVDLPTQTLIAWEDANRVATTRISSGKRGFPTPYGNFPIFEKIPVRRLRASVRGEEWDMPAVPWIMVFRHSGFYIHAAYWHEDFGRPVSHGCVTVPVDFAEWLYVWTPLGARIWIHH